ncbi:MAG: type IV pilin protein [Candidatus Bipolaricaulia bacterium]
MHTWLTKRLKLRVSGDRGFTLIDLVAALAVIGILTSVLIPQFQGHRRRARVAVALRVLDPVRLGMERYRLENGRYPDPDELATTDFSQVFNDPNHLYYLGAIVPGKIDKKKDECKEKAKENKKGKGCADPIDTGPLIGLAVYRIQSSGETYALEVQVVSANTNEVQGGVLIASWGVDSISASDFVSSISNAQSQDINNN